MPAYIGVNGKAKTIAKVYKGNSSGKAELIFGPRGIVRSSKSVENTSTAHNWVGTAHVGNYALIGGGDMYSLKMDAYNTSLTKLSAPDLSAGRYELQGGSVGNYALFAGGIGSKGDIVDAYSASLSKISATKLSVAREAPASATVGNYVLFAGGYNMDQHAYKSTIDAYNSSLTRTSASSLRTTKEGLAGASVGDYALFSGGYNDKYAFNTVDAYNSSLTRTAAPNLNETCEEQASTSIGNYALFGGGGGDSSAIQTVYAYNSSLTKILAPNLSVGRLGLSATSIDHMALFAGGAHANASGDDMVASSVVDVYDSSLSKTLTNNLSMPRYFLSAVSVGKYALFCCGIDYDDNKYANVDAYYLWE